MVAAVAAELIYTLRVARHDRVLLRYGASEVGVGWAATRLLLDPDWWPLDAGVLLLFAAATAVVWGGSRADLRRARGRDDADAILNRWHLPFLAWRIAAVAAAFVAVRVPVGLALGGGPGPAAVYLLAAGGLAWLAWALLDPAAGQVERAGRQKVRGLRARDEDERLADLIAPITRTRERVKAETGLEEDWAALSKARSTRLESEAALQERNADVEDRKAQNDQRRGRPRPRTPAERTAAEADRWWAENVADLERTAIIKGMIEASSLDAGAKEELRRRLTSRERDDPSPASHRVTAVIARRSCTEKAPRVGRGFGLWAGVTGRAA